MNEDNKEMTETTPELPTTKKDNLSIPLAIVFSGILIAGAILFTEKPTTTIAVADQVPAKTETGADAQEAPTALLALKTDDHILGNPNADVVVIEYSDAQCPFCQRFHDTMLKIMGNYGKNGQLAWVYRHFPLEQIHPYAEKGGEALECANEQGGNTAFWKLEDKFFAADTQSIAQSEIPKLAAAIGLDETKMATCVASGKYQARVQRDFQEGVTVGVKGTPYTVIWNRKTGKQMAINGAYPYDNVKTVLGLIAASAQNPADTTTAPSPAAAAAATN
jgi:protein-disulfide isomerase